MEEIKETLEHQSDLIRWKRDDEKSKEQKELLNLAYLAVDEAVSYLNDLEELD